MPYLIKISLLMNGMPRTTPDHHEEQLLLSKYRKLYQKCFVDAVDDRIGLFFFFHDIWLTLPHGNAIFSCFCPSLLLIFHTDGPLLLYHPDQSLNIMRRLDSEIIQGNVIEGASTYIGFADVKKKMASLHLKNLLLTHTHIKIHTYMHIYTRKQICAK